MPDLIIHPSGPLRGSVLIPGDKSITHRALMLAAIAEGDTLIEGWVPAEVCLATLHCMSALGAAIENQEGCLHVRGRGLDGLREPYDVLWCAGSGTTMRLLAGLVAGQPFTTVLTGTEPLRRRPMGRVSEPLRQMGATVLGRKDGSLPPLTIRGGHLKGIEYRLPVASAQVKSAILLAALFAEGETTVHEPGPSRDHTERMLSWFGVEAEGEEGRVRLRGRQRLTARSQRLVIPGDFSSAAFPLVAAAIVPQSAVTLRNTGLNPTRTGLLDLLLQMGGLAAKTGDLSAEGEPAGELIVRATGLRGVEVGGDLVVRAIDEFPIFAVLATQAEGVTVVREAGELRVKESDRIASIVTELRKMGADIEERPDGMVVHGPSPLKGATVECHHDHRLAMSLAIAGLVARGTTVVKGAQAIDDSFPGFVEVMQSLGADIGYSAASEA
jgi:3-phosphoshikimate 1-carboxyvinyltransferase